MMDPCKYCGSPTRLQDQYEEPECETCALSRAATQQISPATMPDTFEPIEGVPGLYRRRRVKPEKN